MKTTNVNIFLPTFPDSSPPILSSQQVKLIPFREETSGAARSAHINFFLLVLLCYDFHVFHGGSSKSYRAYLQLPWNISSSSFFSFDILSAVSHAFPIPSLLILDFIAFSKYAFAKASQTSVMGSAMASGVSTVELSGKGCA